ncbi:hypothetical protein X777_16257 [Ooceraea biroi]|uniref:Nuclease HARBI1 n=1 Tax=Ooceraea biroi TaxID=2015173 RepID=A0A026VU82_OOCBI|nr:hypothetical protein X777_16257 [Ooceraea biroi]
MACYNFVLSSSDDEDIIPHYNRRERRFKELVNYFEVLDELEFKMRFRLSKQTVLLILEQIREELVFLTNRNRAVSPTEQLLLTLRMYATGSFLNNG